MGGASFSRHANGWLLVVGHSPDLSGVFGWVGTQVHPERGNSDEHARTVVVVAVVVVGGGSVSEWIQRCWDI